MPKETLEGVSEKGTIFGTPLWGPVPPWGLLFSPSAPGSPIQLYVDMSTISDPMLTGNLSQDSLTQNVEFGFSESQYF